MKNHSHAWKWFFWCTGILILPNVYKIQNVSRSLHLWTKFCLALWNQLAFVHWRWTSSLCSLWRAFMNHNELDTRLIIRKPGFRLQNRFSHTKCHLDFIEFNIHLASKIIHCKRILTKTPSNVFFTSNQCYVVLAWTVFCWYTRYKIYPGCVNKSLGNEP